MTQREATCFIYISLSNVRTSNIYVSVAKIFCCQCSRMAFRRRRFARKQWSREQWAAIEMDAPDQAPNYRPPPPPKRLDRPKITLQIPDATTPTIPRGPLTATSLGPHYWSSSRYRGRAPTTPASHISDPHGNPYFNPFVHMYHNKASEFMFKQFEGFKDFTMNTAKSGLSAGERSAFWCVNKLKILSKRWFTHLFLTLCLALYSVMGAAMFYALEGKCVN